MGKRGGAGRSSRGCETGAKAGCDRAPRATYTRRVRALVQRTTAACVRVDGSVVGSIETGLVVLFGVGRGDDPGAVPRLAERVARLRVFPDAAGRFDRSLLDIGGAALVVSQFTLYGDTSSGNRPGMSAAAPPGAGRADLRGLRRVAARGGRRARGDRRVRCLDAGRARQRRTGDTAPGGLTGASSCTSLLLFCWSAERLA